MLILIVATAVAFLAYHQSSATSQRDRMGHAAIWFVIAVVGIAILSSTGATTSAAESCNYRC